MPSFTIPNSFGAARVREMNTAHEPGGSPKGGQFAHKAGGPRIAGLLPAASEGTEHTEMPLGVVETLRKGTPASHEPLGSGGINTTLKVTIEDEQGNQIEVIYKPEVGEHWSGSFVNPDINRLKENKDFSLAEREAAAYEVDRLLGTDIVPETIHRTHLIDADDITTEGEDSGPNYDSDEARREYDSYVQKDIAIEGPQWEAAEAPIYDSYNRQKESYVEDVKSRVEEVREIWNELIDAHPEFQDNRVLYGEDIDAHPVLHAVDGGDTLGFKPTKFGDPNLEVDPHEILNKANVNVEGSLTEPERANVRALLMKHLEDGYGALGDAKSDDSIGEDFPEYPDWRDKEGRYPEPEPSQGYGTWKANRGYQSGEGEGRPNEGAAHPDGGSLQRLVDTDWRGSFTPEDVHSFAALDFLIGTMDRHGQNYLFSGGRPKAIDNGYAFPGFHNALLRSAPVTDYIGGTRESRRTPEALRQRLLRNIERADWEGFLKGHPMSRGERDAFRKRLTDLKSALSDGPEGLYNLWRESRVI